MKKIGIVIALLFILTGCGPAQTLETVVDVYAPQTQAEPRKTVLTIPEDASAWVMENKGDKLYFCDGYEIMVETLEAGDLNRTLQELTGFSKDALTVLETGTSEVQRYECIWSASGEAGDQVGRTVILNDGNYHYCLSLTANATEGGSLQEVWQQIAVSFGLQS